MKNLKSLFTINLSLARAFCFAALFIHNPSFAQDSLKKASEITFSTALNHPNIPKDFFKNKYVVLDFWATWCGPCIASFPHLDSLSRKFSSDSVVFAIISSETKAKVARFLSKRKIKAVYLLDSITKASKANATINELYGITAQNFGVRGIPYTVVIDKDNNLIWTSVQSRDLTEYDLYNIIHHNGRKIMEARNILKNNALTKAEQRKKVFEITKKDTLKENNSTFITASLPYNDYMMSAGQDPAKQIRFVEMDGHPFDFYYFYFTRIPFNRIINKSKLSSIYVRYESNIATPTKDFFKTGLDLLRKAYHLEYVRKNKIVDAYTLEIIDQARFKLKSRPLQEASSDHVSSDITDSELVYSNFTLEDIGKGLEDYLKMPVVLSNDAYKNIRCDMTIKITKKVDILSLNSFLALNYGLRLKKAKRSVEFIEIDQSPESGTQ